MRGSIRARARPLAVGLAVALLGGLSPGPAAAQDVTVAGETQGCFFMTGGSCTFGTMAGILGLTFTGQAFSELLTPPFDVEENVDVGTFSLNSTAANYNGINFWLLTTFSSPPISSGNNPTTEEAILVGQVASDGTGGVVINYTDNVEIFTFNDGAFSGTFQYFVETPTTLLAGTSADQLADFTLLTATAVPEPVSLLLLGTGLAGLAGAGARRRRRDGVSEV